MRSPEQLSRQTGMTLIELMIVVVVVAVLAGVALPAYENNMLKARRSDAYATLLDVASRQEQNMLDRSSYTLVMADLGYPVDRIGATPNVIVSEEGHYDVGRWPCPGAEAGPSCYVLTASARADGGQVKDEGCNTIVLRSDGRKESFAKGKTLTDAVSDGRCW